MQRSISLPFSAIGHLIAMLVIAMTLLAIPTAQAQWFGIYTGVRGDGKRVEDVRAVAPFTKIQSEGAVDLIVTQTAGPQKLTVEADSNIAPLILTRVESGVLIISNKKNWSSRLPIVLRASVETISGVKLSGSGNVAIHGLKGKEFNLAIVGSGDARMEDVALDQFMVSISGSGDVFATGKATTQNIRVAGSGDVRVDELEAKDVTVAISGSGDVRVFATEKLEARVSGSGDVRYRGSPAVKKAVSGSGEIKQM